MIIKNYQDSEEEKVSEYGSKDVTIRWLIHKTDGALRFAMRRFKISPGGVIGLHSHPEEHEIYIMQGEGILMDDEGREFPVKKDDVIYVPSFENHGYKNEGTEDFVFLCIIPYLR